jgi:formate hydrogenlyase subunit 6/NADH:ubiquinone oxidoreductase subunit I
LNIIRLLWKNFFGGAITLRFPQTAPTEANFRGQLQIDESRCSGCGRCATFCTTKCLEVTRDKENKEAFQWSYDAGKCTFCGRCMDGCKTFKALSMEQNRPPVYTKVGALKQLHKMIRKKPAAKPAAAAPTSTEAAPTPPGAPGL